MLTILKRFNYKSKSKKILLIANPNSIHTARWISQFKNEDWQLFLYPSVDSGKIHPEIQDLTYFYTYLGKPQQYHPSIKFRGNIFKYLPYGTHTKKKILDKFIPDFRAKDLSKVIEKVKPDIIHSLEIQSAGYLTLEVKLKYFQSKNFPKWIVTNWGSDIYLFGKLQEHQHKIRQVLAECNYYSCECHRDIKLGKEFGFIGKSFPVFPNTGGFDLENISKYRRAGLTSERRIIMLKGYQTWAGRSLFGLRALERCAELLTDYTIVIYSANEDVALAAKLFSAYTSVETKLLLNNTTHNEILKYHGKARISIGLNISDGISTSLLEAIVMGSFPIQSWTSCGNEWLKDGETGFLVPPEDPEIIEKAIRKALTDDQLVDNASQKNIELAKRRLDSKIIQPMAVNFYQTILNDSISNH